jgi:putative effector of murein hydrolase
VIPDITAGGTVAVASGTASAPEIDPAAALSGLTLLLGAVAVLHGPVARKT